MAASSGSGSAAQHTHTQAPRPCLPPGRAAYVLSSALQRLSVAAIQRFSVVAVALFKSERLRLAEGGCERGGMGKEGPGCTRYALPSHTKRRRVCNGDGDGDGDVDVISGSIQ